MTKVKSDSQAEVYRHLAMLFYPPDKVELEKFGVFDHLVGYARQFDSDLLLGVTELQDEYNSFTEEELKIEFSKLFIGPFELAAPPYGSVYLDEKYQIHGPSTVMVQNIYQNNNLLVELAEPPDHIAIELEFIALMLQEDQPLDEENEFTTFFKDLFEPWVNPFCERILKGTTNNYFICLAGVLKAVVDTTSYGLSD